MIPLILRRLEKKNLSVQLIADGLGSNYNHVNSKGVNILKDTDILVEVSIPHPAEVKKVCVRIPAQRCHLIQAKAATHSTAKLPPIPVKVATL